MKFRIALAVLAAAVAPCLAISDPVSPVDILSTNNCHVIIGTLASVHTDPARFGTDIILDHILPSPVPEPLIQGGSVMALIPADSMKAFPALDSYVGQEVTVWDRVSGGFGGRSRSMQIAMPEQLELLSSALADPKNTWCHLSPLKKRYG